MKKAARHFSSDVKNAMCTKNKSLLLFDKIFVSTYKSAKMTQQQAKYKR